MTAAQEGSDSAWVRHSDSAVGADDAGVVLHAWREDAGRTQTDVAEVWGTTQQHVSQIEQGRRPVPLELPRKMVIELGITAEDRGLSSGCARRLVSQDDASPQIGASRLRWREERRWLHQPPVGAGDVGDAVRPGRALGAARCFDRASRVVAG